jgi:putative ABC transport system permease protein
VISDALWRRGFGSDPRVIGRTLRIDEDVYEIIGVMPPAFRHPSLTLETDVEVWSPTGWRASPFPPPSHSARFMPSAIGRLAPGVSVTAAMARVEARAQELARAHPDDYPSRLGWTPRVYPLASDLVAGVRPALLILMGGVVFVMLIAISNISNLLLVRAIEREREVAIQRALGASRMRMIASLLVEGMVLAVAGGLLGFLASLWGVDLLLRLVPERLPRATEIAADRRVLLFAMLTSTLVGLLVSLVPALQSARGDVIQRLKAAGRHPHGGATARTRNALVVAQIAIAIVLLANAALLARSLWNLQNVETGMETRRLVTGRIWLPQPNEPSSGPYFTHAQRLVVMRAIVDRLRASTEVSDAGLATALPATGDSGTTSFTADGWGAEKRDFARATAITVSPGYFGALGMRRVAGRLLEDQDTDRVGRVVVINETLARTYFAGEDPVGRRFQYVGQRGQIPRDAPWITIVGVVSDVAEDGLETPVRPQIYQCLWQVSNLNLAIVASGRHGAPSAAAVRSAVQAADPNLPVYAIRTGDELLERLLAQRRFATYLIYAFALAALFLAAFGLHGVIAYSVRQRTHEIGVRIALGATVARVIGLVLGQAARVTALGMVIGLGGALLASRLVATMLFNVRPTNPWLLGAVVAILGAVVGCGTFGAALRASRIEAATALRQE